MTERPKIFAKRSTTLPLFAHADVLQDRFRAVQQRARQRSIGAAAILGLALIWTTMMCRPLPRLVWNASASAPIGLYAVRPGAPVKRGEMVIAWAPRNARALAAARHYLPPSVPLVKRVRAVAGDRICAEGAAITINGRLVADRRRRDRAGRLLPWWHGCATLRKGMFLLLNDAPESFDGRYFGITRASDIIGMATPLWLR